MIKQIREKIMLQQEVQRQIYLNYLAILFSELQNVFLMKKMMTIMIQQIFFNFDQKITRVKIIHDLTLKIETIQKINKLNLKNRIQGQKLAFSN